MTSITVNVAPPAGKIVLARPDRHNALDRQMLDELSQAFFDLHQEKRVRGVVLSARGTNYCAGLDLHEMHQTATGDLDAAQQAWHDDWMRLHDVLETMLRFPKPIVAAVDGAALGGGLGLVLASDMVVAADRATFGTPATERGLVAGVVAPLLCHRAGSKTAARMLLTSAVIGADEALQQNLIDEIAPAGEIEARASGIIERIAAAPTEAIQLSKRLLNEIIGEQLLTQMSVGAAMGATSCTTEAAAEGLTAFVERRDPNWP